MKILAIALACCVVAPASASAHSHHAHHRRKPHNEFRQIKVPPAYKAPADTDTFALAETRAAQYWGVQPCGGTYRLEVGGTYTLGPLGIPPAMWVSFDTPSGHLDWAATPTTYFNCVVHVNPSDPVANAEWRVNNFAETCQLMVHEFGHFMGFPDNNEPGTLMYEDPIMAPLVQTCQHYEIWYEGFRITS